MRLTLADLLCSLAAPAFAAPDVNSANFILPHCKMLSSRTSLLASCRVSVRGSSTL